MLRYAKILFGVIVVALFLPLSTASAREDYFRPAAGEILSGVPGAERVSVDSGGLLTATAGNGTILSGFPVSSVNAVFSSSPVLADVNGDGIKEIAVISRDSLDTYSLEIYSGAGVLLASSPIVGAVYFDPVVLFLSGQVNESIIVSTNEGKVSEWSLKGNTLSANSIMSSTTPVAAAVGANGNVYLAYPKLAKFEIYNKNFGVWTKSKSYTLPKAVIFPLVDSGDGKLFGIYDDNSLVAINISNGTIVTGFPVSLSAPVLSEPVLADFDSANPGKEIVIELSNGDREIFKIDGSILQQQKSVRGYADDSVSASDDYGVFYSVNQLGGKIVNILKEIVSAVYSKIKLLVNAVINPALSSISAISSASSGVAPLEVQFDVAVQGAVPFLPAPLNFTTSAFTTFVSAIDGPTGELTKEDNGNTIKLIGPNAKSSDYNYNITNDTILELDFKSTGNQSALHGFGFDVPSNTTKFATFQLYGFAAPGWTQLIYNNYKPSGWKHYKIPIGNFYTGQTNKIFFINRGDLTTNSFFRNIQIYEKPDAKYSYAWDVDGDGKVDSTEKSPRYIFTIPGNYNIKLDVSDGMATTTKPLAVSVLNASELNISIKADPVADAAQTIQYDISIAGLVPFLPAPLNFTTSAFTTFVSAIDGPTGELTKEDNGNTIKLIGPNAKSSDYNYNITNDTILELDFKSTGNQSALHGFGFDVPSNTTKFATFQLYGFAAPGWTQLIYNNYKPSGWKHYKIPIGNFYTGQTNKIFFINRGDLTTNSFFRNIQIYEKPDAKYSYAWDVDGDGKVDSTEKSFYYTFIAAGAYNSTVQVTDGAITKISQINVMVK